MTQDQIAREHKTAHEINEQWGKLTSCTRCKGKGYIHIVDEKGYHKSIDCGCKPREEGKK
jgi:hypothetical protein